MIENYFFSGYSRASFPRGSAAGMSDDHKNWNFIVIVLLVLAVLLGGALLLVKLNRWGHHPLSRYTDALLIPKRLATSEGPNPCSSSLVTSATSPAALSAARCSARFWSMVLTRA